MEQEELLGGGRRSFSQEQAEEWLRRGHRLVAEDHEKLLTQQGALWSPAGAAEEVERA
jgi:hypothetical protein